MSTNYPKGSMGDGDARNQKLAAIIYIVAFIGLHALMFIIPDHPRFHVPQIIVTTLATGALAFLVREFWTNADLTEDFKWPEGLVIALAAASLVLIGWVGDHY